MSKSLLTNRSNTAAHGAGGLVMGTRVMTIDGDLPVEHLCIGDRILTRAGVRALTSISVRVERDMAMVRVGASTLGHDRPADDALLPAAQMILVRDWRAKALYGAPQALVPAARLADGNLIRLQIVPEARVFTLGFGADAVIYASGLEVACLREVVTA